MNKTQRFNGFIYISLFSLLLVLSTVSAEVLRDVAIIGGRVNIKQVPTNTNRIPFSPEYNYPVYEQIKVDMYCKGATFQTIPDILAGDVKSTSDNEKIDRLLKAIETLDITEPESINSAVKMYQTIFPYDAPDAEEGFRLLRGFYKKVIRSCDRNFYEKNNLQNALNEIAEFVRSEEKETHIADIFIWQKFQSYVSPHTRTIRDKLKKEIAELDIYSKNGIFFELNEGDWYLVENNRFLLDKVLKNYDFPLKRYIEFLVEEQNRHPEIAEDAGLCITWEELRERILRWEFFSKRHPFLKETGEDVIPEIRHMLDVYLFGIDNSRVYCLETKKIKDKVKMSYEKFIEENKDSNYYSTVKKVYEIYKKNNFLFDEKIKKEVKEILSQKQD